MIVPKVSDILAEARDKIADPKRWTRGAMARDAQIRGTYHSAPDACRWCAEGAIRSVFVAHGSLISSHRPWIDLWTRAFAALKGQIPGEYDEIADFNDHARTKHEDVLALFDRAIEAAKRKEAQDGR